MKTLPKSSTGDTSATARGGSSARASWTLVLLVAIGLGGAATSAWWHGLTELPSLPPCMFHALTGLHCPGCGATRATGCMLSGRLIEAMRYNLLWVVLSPVAGYAVISALHRQKTGRPLPGDVTQMRWFWPSLAAVALVFAVLRNLPWYPLTLLAPPG